MNASSTNGGTTLTSTGVEMVKEEYIAVDDDDMDATEASDLVLKFQKNET